MIGRRQLLKIAGLAAASSVFGRGASAQAATKVGVIGSTSGILSFAGQSARRGAELAGAYLKQRNGPPIELFFADTESRAENGRVTAERLIREGCTILIGAIDSGATISAAQVTEAAKVPLVVNVGAAPEITERGYAFVFRNFMPSPALVTGAVQRIKELIQGVQGRKPETAVLMYVNDTFGQSASAAVTQLWTKLDVPIKIVEQITYDIRSRDLAVEVGKAKAAQPDILLTVMRVNDGILIVREMVKQNFSPMALISPGSPGSYEKPFTDTLGKYADDAINCVPWYNMKNPRMADILNLWKQQFSGHRFELNAAFTFEAVEIVADAIRRAGSSDSERLREALRTTNIADHITTGGPIQFDEKGQNRNIQSAMLQNRDGEPIVVGPPELSVAPPRFPMTPFDRR